MRINTPSSRIVFAAVIAASALYSFGLSCNDKSGRYVNRNVFGSVKVSSNIQFGSNKNPLHNNAVENLFTDFYEPAGDTCTLRPLIIFMWGGGFQSGTRQGEDGDCRQFAQRGFACATTDYRKGNPGSYTIPNFCGPTFMSTQDTRAAIRFYRKNAAQYHIDTSLIYVGGCSSGAYAAMHTGYLDKAEEIPTYLGAQFTEGGIEGTSGNPGYDSRPAGVLALSGGLFDSAWVGKNSVPLAAVYCLHDAIESPDSLHDGTGGKAFVPDYDVTRLTPRFQHMGVPLQAKSYNQDCHCPHFTDATGQDETVDFLAKSAYKFMTAPSAVSLHAISLNHVTPMLRRMILSSSDLESIRGGGGEWFDVRGNRIATKPGPSESRAASGPSASAFRPGLYFQRPRKETMHE